MKVIKPIVLYCHGLGGSPNNSFARRIKWLVESRHLDFQSVWYRNVGPQKLWDVDEWLEDILCHIDRVKLKGFSRTILIGFSGGCHGVLRAAVKKPTDICGLLLLAPGVGLHLESYVKKALPDLAEELLKGKSVLYPPVKDGYPVLINAECLQKYSEKCISNYMTRIPIQCPVRILHGADDEVVPLKNIKRFMKKLESKDIEKKVLPGIGHFISITADFEALFDSLLAAVDPLEIQRADKPNSET